jgi:hypothetical protein
MPVIPVNKVVDPKRIMGKNGGPRRRRGTRVRGRFFPRKVLNLTKYALGYDLGDFSQKSIRSPCFVVMLHKKFLSTIAVRQNALQQQLHPAQWSLIHNKRRHIFYLFKNTHIYTTAITLIHRRDSISRPIPPVSSVADGYVYTTMPRFLVCHLLLL